MITNFNWTTIIYCVIIPRIYRTPLTRKVKQNCFSKIISNSVLYLFTLYRMVVRNIILQVCHLGEIINLYFYNNIYYLFDIVEKYITFFGKKKYNLIKDMLI